MAQGMISRRGAVIGSRAGGMFFGVELPRSIYYAQAAEWVQVSTGGGPNIQTSIVCNGTLYGFSTDKNIYAVNLATGECTLALTTVRSWDYNYSIATDKTARIWLTYGNTCFEYNVITGAFREFAVACGPYSAQTSVFSTTKNTLYILGGTYQSGFPRPEFGIYDMLDNKGIVGPNLPVATQYNYCWFDEDNEELYAVCCHGSSGNNVTQIYKYLPATNAWTAVVAPGPQTPAAYQITSMCNIGKTCYMFSSSGVVAFDITTGETVTAQMPGPIAIPLRSMVGVYGNKFYASIGTGFYSLTFFENPPADAPTVCKIYKGQKFHTLVPFEIPAKNLTITTTPQTAAEDIEIKMYDYSAEGGQVIFIET